MRHSAIMMHSLGELGVGDHLGPVSLVTATKIDSPFVGHRQCDAASAQQAAEYLTVNRLSHARR